MHRRYLRARKFDVNGAYGQFTDTEKWMKEQYVDDLYEHFDVDFYEKARLVVSCVASHLLLHHNLTLAVPPMDWPTGQKRHSHLRL